MMWFYIYMITMQAPPPRGMCCQSVGGMTQCWPC